MKFCSHCGNEIKSKSEFCSNCGAKLEKVEKVDAEVVKNDVTASNTNNKSDNVTAAFVCSIIGCLCCTYVAIPGLVLSIMALRDMSAGKISDEKKWMAIVGIILSVIGLIQMVINIIHPNQDVINRINELFDNVYE